VSNDAASPADAPPREGGDRILLLVGDASNRQLLAGFLDQPGYSVVRPGDGSVPEDVDLCLVDPDGYRAAREELVAASEAERPRHLPCLLVAPDGEVGADRAGGADADAFARLDEGEELIDDVLLTPVRKAELRRRVEALLRIRRLSLALGDRERQYRRLVELTPEAIFLVEAGRVVYANEAGQRLLSETGTDPDVEPELSSLVAPGDRERVAELLASVRRGDAPGEFVPARVPRSAPDEGPLSVELAGTRVDYHDGTATQLVVRDVTERERRERKLHLYRRAMDEASVGLTIADARRDDEPLVYANRAFERITGYPVPEALGRNCRFLQGEETDPEAVARVRSAIEEERSVRVTLRNYRRDGTPFWNELEVTPVRDADGTVTHFVGFQRDVTDRIERERELTTLHGATRRFLSATSPESIAEVVIDAVEEALDLPAVAVFLSDGDRLVPVAATESTRALFGEVPTLEPGDSIAWDVFERGEAEIVDDVANDARAYDPESPARSELHVPLGDHGLLVSGSDAAADFGESDLQFVRTLAMNASAALDRTDRERELRRRKRELQRYETIVRAAGEPIYTLDAEGRFVDANEALAELTGYPVERLVGSHVSLVMDGEDIDRAEAAIAGFVSGDGPTDASLEIGIERVDGEVRRCLVNIALLPFDDEFRGTVGVVRDITDRHRRTQRLEVMDRVLRHNLRNEMNVVRGRAEALRGAVPEEGLDHVDEVVRSANALLSLSEGARRFHEAFHEADDRGVLDLATEAGGAVESVAGQHPNATVETDLPDAAPVRAHRAVRIAVEELVENAVVHSDDPDPTVRVSVSPGEARTDLVVADDGPGIPPTERRTIEGDVESALEHASGLGLWLVSWIVDSSGGEVDCEVSESGTVVRVRLRNA
jgi:PAS domain S-box-containing protein